jgi:hypothetical protein
MKNLDENVQKREKRIEDLNRDVKREKEKTKIEDKII